MRIGIVANEFFDLSIGRMGGFGWAARQATGALRRSHGRRFETFFLAGEIKATPGQPDPLVHDTPLILRRDDAAEHAGRVRDLGLDLLLSIDYRPHYEALFRMLPETPIVVWVRDPRTPEDVRRIGTVRVPNADAQPPPGLVTPNCTSLGGVVADAAVAGRPVLFATTNLSLAEKIPSVYGAAPTDVPLLPNVVDIDPGAVVKSTRPSVVFLGRLDPIKRPWIFAELARRLPDVDFFFLGKTHFQGTGCWEPGPSPGNLHWLGHVDGDRKRQLLSEAWALVNCSIHESLAVSFLEALACETPLLAAVDPGGVVSRYGLFAGRWEGSGLDGLPRFAAALSRLLEDGELRRRLGREGRRWVAETHNGPQFLRAFEHLCVKAGCAAGPPGGDTVRGPGGPADARHDG